MVSWYQVWVCVHFSPFTFVSVREKRNPHERFYFYFIVVLKSRQEKQKQPTFIVLVIGDLSHNIYKQSVFLFHF